MEAFPGLRRRPAALALPVGVGGDVDRHAGMAQIAGFLEQRLAAVHMGRVEHAGWQFRLLQQAPDQLQAPLAIAQVQVQHPRLAAQQPGHVHLRGQPRKLIESRLA